MTLEVGITFCHQNLKRGKEKWCVEEETHHGASITRSKERVSLLETCGPLRVIQALATVTSRRRSAGRFLC